MPLAALALVHLAAGLGIAAAYAGELRGSPRASWTLPGFTAFCLHELLVAVPAAFYLLARHTDWMLSYTVGSGRVPSAAGLALAASGLGAFVVGARFVRDQHPRLPAAGAAALTALALLGLVLARGRVGAVGTTSQFRGGFGMVPFGVSRASTAVLLAVTIQAAAVAHLAWTLARPRRPLGP